MDKHTILKNIYGYDSFRIGQEELIDSVMNGRDALGIMPTGAGKSICFQVPALAFGGISLVISPLISLMKDQVTALVEVGVRAAYINSSLTEGQIRKVMENARLGVYKIIYVAPERLLTDSFLALVNAVGISMIAIDEAHCISQWGQDFRPSYLKITDFIEMLPVRPVIAAFTATATNAVKDDIICMLGMENPAVVVTGYDRKNLYFGVRKPQSKMNALLDYLKENGDKSGIIYCNTRKAVEEVQEELLRRGYPVTRYHAGLSDSERKENQEAFINDRTPVMAATNAFGMGIDKSNVRYVIHYNMPKDLESYYQEAGRAGRDGEAAECILYYSGQDVRMNEFLIDKQMERENDELDSEEKELILARDRERLRKMTYYCFSNGCLREYILRYFGEYGAGSCGNCENCLTEFEDVDITDDASSIISLIQNSGQRYGINAVLDAVHGTDNAKVRQLRLHENPFFGALRSRTIVRLRQTLNHLLVSGYLHLTTDQYPVLKITKQGMEYLLASNPIKPILLKLPKKQEETAAKKSQKRVSGAEVRHPELFELLRKRRFEIAQGEHKPPYIIFSDKTLKEMCNCLPTTEKAMLEINGVGSSKLEKYGSEFMRLIKEYKKERRF